MNRVLPQTTGGEADSRRARIPARSSQGFRECVTAYFTEVSQGGVWKGLTMVGSSDIRPVEARVAQLEEAVTHLTEAVERLADTIANGSEVEQKVLVLRTVSRDEAKQEIVQLFQSGDVLDYGDVAEELRISLPLVVELCAELEEEGVIEACQ